MKILITHIILIFFVGFGVAQTKEKAEKAFVVALNNILKSTKEQHWKYEGKMKIDTPFAINKKGILSVTVCYINDDSTVIRTRMETPINKILKVAYDLYLILECDIDKVIVYESAVNDNLLKQVYKTKYFHIGVPLNDDYLQQEKLQKALEKLLKFYKK